MPKSITSRFDVHGTRDFASVPGTFLRYLARTWPWLASRTEDFRLHLLAPEHLRQTGKVEPAHRRLVDCADGVQVFHPRMGRAENVAAIALPWHCAVVPDSGNDPKSG